VPPPAVLYVEGPRDRDILEGWARAASPPLARAVRDSTVILGGRQLARAEAHFEEEASARPGLRGLCVLDRDGGGETGVAGTDRLEVFIWSRRHIESYLLVPAAIQRALRLPEHDGRLSRLLRQHLPEAADEGTLRDLDAKRLLSATGPIARGLGRPLALGRIARAMRADELHGDVSGLLARLREKLLAPEVLVTLATGLRR
jgi:hypothetical protein